VPTTNREPGPHGTPVEQASYCRHRGRSRMAFPTWPADAAPEIRRRELDLMPGMTAEPSIGAGCQTQRVVFGTLFLPVARVTALRGRSPRRPATFGTRVLGPSRHVAAHPYPSIGTPGCLSFRDVPGSRSVARRR
jgi:hypothetical protein